MKIIEENRGKDSPELPDPGTPSPPSNWASEDEKTLKNIGENKGNIKENRRKAEKNEM